MAIKPEIPVMADIFARNISTPVQHLQLSPAACSGARDNFTKTFMYVFAVVTAVGKKL